MLSLLVNSWLQEKKVGAHLWLVRRVEPGYLVRYMAAYVASTLVRSAYVRVRCRSADRSAERDATSALGVSSRTPILPPPESSSRAAHMHQSAAEITSIGGIMNADPDCQARREFLSRDRTPASPPAPQTGATPRIVPTRPRELFPNLFTREVPPPQEDTDDSSVTAARPRPQTVNVKLPSFYGRYTENVKAWISITEDGFNAKHTAKEDKVPSISHLFKGDARTWYLTIKEEYRRIPTWEELKMELLVKFAQSSIHRDALRDRLRAVPYNGPKRMGQYVSNFRYIETQIGKDEMAFGDRFTYFISPFTGTLQRHLKREHAKTMEIVYDAAIDWANIENSTDSSENEPESTKGSSTSDAGMSSDSADTEENENLRRRRRARKLPWKLKH